MILANEHLLGNFELSYIMCIRVRISLGMYLVMSECNFIKNCEENKGLTIIKYLLYRILIINDFR